jgi:hypothetical protein
MGRIDTKRHPREGNIRPVNLLKDDVALRAALLRATALAGADGQGKRSLVGYLRRIAGAQLDLFVRLLERLLVEEQKTAARAESECKRRKKPAPRELDPKREQGIRA